MSLVVVALAWLLEQQDPHAILDRTIALDVRNAPLAQFLDEAAVAAGTTIVIDRAAQSIPSVAEPVTLRVHGGTLKSVLRAVLWPRGLTVVWREGAFHVVPKPSSDEPLETRFYDVTEVLARIRGFYNVTEPVPCAQLDPWRYSPNGEFRITPASALLVDPQIGILTWGTVLDVRPIVTPDRRYVILEARPTHADLEGIEQVDVPFGNFLSATATPEELERTKQLALVELVRAQTAEAGWPQGTSIHMGGRLLVVRHTPAVHREIRELLEALGTLPQ